MSSGRKAATMTSRFILLPCWKTSLSRCRIFLTFCVAPLVNRSSKGMPYLTKMSPVKSG